jgi:peptidoglycan/xylan/chitin deacetylase (PgdA/CDA1 family)
LNDLKLTVVRHAAGRVLVAAVLFLATSYMLQLDDSLRPATVPALKASLEIAPILVAQAGTRGREYFVSRHEVVPVGTPAIRLPILMYHYIRRPPSMRTDMLGYKLSVSPEDFRTQMDWLYANGYHPVNFHQVRSYFEGARALPSRPIVITFDDGYQDLYTEAFPILQAHGFTAVAYIVTSFVGRPAYVSREQVVEMDRAGLEIGSHTVDHANLARMSFGSTTYQVLQSKHSLEEMLGHQVLDFAYPSGQFNGQTMVAVRDAGYDTAVTTAMSTTHSMIDRYAWGRVRVGGGESMEDFISSLGTSMPSVTITTVDVEPLPVYPEHKARLGA